MQHRLYEKDGRHNNILPKQTKYHDRLLKKSKSHKSKGKGKGHDDDDDDDHDHNVIIIVQPSDDEYGELPYCD
jgi:hypothetical protein